MALCGDYYINRQPPFGLFSGFRPLLSPIFQRCQLTEAKKWFVWEFEQENIHFSLIKSHVFLSGLGLIIVLSCLSSTQSLSHVVAKPSKATRSADVLSGKYFLGTALDVLSGRHLSASLVKVVTCFCQSCCWIWSPFRVRPVRCAFGNVFCPACYGASRKKINE